MSFVALFVYDQFQVHIELKLTLCILVGTIHLGAIAGAAALMFFCPWLIPVTHWKIVWT